MITEQAKNLVNFSILTHSMLDEGILGHDPSYIMEKWDKYIGIEPNKMSDEEFDKVKYDHPILGIWIAKWRVKDEQIENMKSILTFIVKVNQKHFYTRGFDTNSVWLLSALVELFDKVVGNANNINRHLYNNLHHNVVKVIENWRKHKNVLRDYNLELLT
jgi:hypothetical protein